MLVCSTIWATPIPGDEVEVVEEVNEVNEVDDAISPATSGKFEGDIVFTRAQLMNQMSKTGLRNPYFRWTGRTIPYQFNGQHSKFFQKNN